MKENTNTEKHPQDYTASDLSDQLNAEGKEKKAEDVNAAKNEIVFQYSIYTDSTKGKENDLGPSNLSNSTGKFSSPVKSEGS